jgi:hypothetical protein
MSRRRLPRFIGALDDHVEPRVVAFISLGSGGLKGISMKHGPRAVANAEAAVPLPADLGWLGCGYREPLGVEFSPSFNPSDLYARVPARLRR